MEGLLYCQRYYLTIPQSIIETITEIEGPSGFEIL
jgi:hypothetical protein